MTGIELPIQQEYSLYHRVVRRLTEKDTALQAASAEQILRFHRLRDKVFQPMLLFSDPAWEILLEIFRSTARGIAITVTDTASCAGIASSSATRWIRTLEASGLVCRTPDPDDKRRVLLDMTPTGRMLMNRTLDKWLLEDKAAAAPLFFPESRKPAKATAVLARLRGMLDYAPLTDLPALIMRCLGEFLDEHQAPTTTAQSPYIEAQVERMLGIEAYESAILLIGRTFVQWWSPRLSGGRASGILPTSADLGRALLRDLLDTVLAGHPDGVAG